MIVCVNHYFGSSVVKNIILTFLHHVYCKRSTFETKINTQKRTCHVDCRKKSYF